VVADSARRADSLMMSVLAGASARIEIEAGRGLRMM
jgi:hypothetical protein